MNILYIFGNGLDLSLGMKTKYSNFYTYLDENKDQCSDALKSMLSEIKADTTNLWSDMEVALGKYTMKFNAQEEFESFYIELTDKLTEYLREEESKYIPNKAQQDSFIANILSPQKLLLQTDRSIFQQRHNPNQVHVDILSLNYTDTILKLLSKNSDSNLVQINTPTLGKILHIHRRITNSIILGVSNAYQILNEKFSSNLDVADYLIKPQSNLAIGDTFTQNCSEMVNQSNVIFLYGVSLGDTDEYIWKIIGDKFRNTSNLGVILNVYTDKGIDDRHLQKRGRLTRENKTLVLKKLGFSDAEITEELKSHVYCIFDKKLTEKQQ